MKIIYPTGLVLDIPEAANSKMGDRGNSYVLLTDDGVSIANVAVSSGATLVLSDAAISIKFVGQEEQ